MIEAHLTNELKLILFDMGKDKEIRSFPKKGKKNIYGIIRSQIEGLKKQFVTGSTEEQMADRKVI